MIPALLEAWGRRLPPLEAEGAVMDPGFRALCWLSGRLPPLSSRSPAGARAQLRRSSWLVRPEAPAGVAVRELGGAPAIREYLPPGARGLILYFHGGGFVVGDLTTHHGVAAQLALASGRRVWSVDYRLAPEHPFPAAFEDALAAFDRCDEAPSVMGDSAGGTLALYVARQRPVTWATLVYPSLDRASVLPSARAFARGYLLDQELIHWFSYHHLQGQSASDVRVSPGRGSVEGLPPLRVAVAGFDPLRDEGLAFAARVRAAGGVVEEVVHPQFPHGWVQLAGASSAARAALWALGEAEACAPRGGSAAGRLEGLPG